MGDNAININVLFINSLTCLGNENIVSNKAKNLAGKV